MTSYAWWKTLSLFFWFYNATATAMVLAYFYGICRLAEERFGGRTYAPLLILFFVFMGSGTLIYALGESAVAIYPRYAIWPALAGLLLLVVVYRVYRLMLGK